MTEYLTYRGNTYRVDYSTETIDTQGQWFICIGHHEIKLKALLVILVIILCGVILYVFNNQKNQLMSEKGNMVNQFDYPASVPPDSAQSPTRFSETGIVFPDSDKRFLTIQDVNELSLFTEYSEKELLRYAINELYARHGYSFTSTKYAEHYKKYGFNSFTDAESAIADFNEYELANLTFLCGIEKERGYR